MIICNNIRLGVDSRREDAFSAAMKKAGVKSHQLSGCWINKVSIDARKGKVSLVYSVGMSMKEEFLEAGICARDADLQLKAPEKIEFRVGPKAIETRPIVIGFGPAGFMRALVLAQMGMKPLVIEQGGSIEERNKAVRTFETKRTLDTSTNVQFGEGGAGTFSDGKLTTRINDSRCNWVLDQLVAHGAPEEITRKAKPHIGTDLLGNVVKSIREDIISMGGQVLFNTRMTDIITKNGSVCAVRTDKGEFPAQTVILATGHSAREVFGIVENRGAVLTAKPFSVGVRIEHLQNDIDRALYHELAGHPNLSKGEYQLSWTKGERGVYTFCMCPGGTVVAARSETDTVVTNGMSRHARDGINSNSALVVSVSNKDFDSDYRKRISFQRELEHKAFRLGGGDYSAPAQTVGRFIEGRSGMDINRIIPTYPLGVREADFDLLFPAFVTKGLRDALGVMDTKISGFAAADAVLTGPETRTSSPVRIERNGEYVSGIGGLYPAGEGAGYAGGIMSAAVDGVRVAQQICTLYRAADRRDL